MLLPIVAVDVGIGNGVAAVDHLPVAQIDAYMGHAVGVRRVVGMPEENQITGLGICHGYGGTDVVKPLRAQPSHVPSAVIDHPRNKTGTVKGSAGTAADPDDERIIPKN